VHQIATHRVGLSVLSACNVLVHISELHFLQNLNQSIRQKLCSCDAVKPREYLLKAQSNHSNESTVLRISMTDATVQTDVQSPTPHNSWNTWLLFHWRRLHYDLTRQCTCGETCFYSYGLLQWTSFGKLLVEFNCSLSCFWMEINVHPQYVTTIVRNASLLFQLANCPMLSGPTVTTAWRVLS
jgi:hypothetical protein